MTELPRGVLAMMARGPEWVAWVDELPTVAQRLLAEWTVRPDGPATHGACSLVLPVRTHDGDPAVLKISFPDAESEHEHLALQRWGGAGAVRLLRAEPRRRALLLERLRPGNLNAPADVEACQIVAGLYRRLHVPALPQLRTLTSYVEHETDDLAALARSAPIPRRLVEQATAFGRDLISDQASTGRIIHGDLHYENVLAADREPWLVIDPKPMNGDPHYELAPMLWNRWDELAGDVREGVRRRFYALVEAAGLDEDRARAWVIVRAMHNAMWQLQDGPQADPKWLTMCGTVTLIVMCSGAVCFGAVAMNKCWVVHISGGSVERGDFTPDCEAVGHLGSPLGRAEQMSSRPKMCRDAAKSRQEPLGVPQRFKAFHPACGGLKPPPDRRLRRAKPSSPAEHRFLKVLPIYIQTPIPRSWRTSGGPCTTALRCSRHRSSQVAHAHQRDSAV